MKTKITLEIEDQEQLDVILTQLEAMFPVQTPRTKQGFAQQLQIAEANWEPTTPRLYAEYAYDVAKIAPVYLGLLEHWKSRAEPGSLIRNHSTRVFKDALRKANACCS